MRADEEPDHSIIVANAARAPTEGDSNRENRPHGMCGLEMKTLMVPIISPQRVGLLGRALEVSVVIHLRQCPAGTVLSKCLLGEPSQLIRRFSEGGFPFGFVSNFFQQQSGNGVLVLIRKPPDCRECLFHQLGHATILFSIMAFVPANHPTTILQTNGRKEQFA